MRSTRFAAVAALSLAARTLADDGQAPQMALTRVLTFDEIPKAPGVGEVTAASQPEPAAPAMTSDEPTGNWGGLRDQLSAAHLYLGGFVQVDDAKNMRGGLDTAAWPVSYLLDLHLTADLEGMLGWSGAAAYADFQSHDQFGNGDRIVGDVQVYDNITAPRFVQVAQLWLRQDFPNALSLKIGKIDANIDAAKPGADAHDGFSLLDHSADFLHSGAVFSPTIFALPTYPLGAPGIEAFFGNPAYVGAGAFYNNTHQTFLKISGFPESTARSAGGMFFIGEAGTRWEGVGDQERPGHAGIGAWFHNGAFPRNDGDGKTHGTGGGYAFLDQTLYLDKSGPTRDLGAIFIASLADKTTSPMDQSLMMGLNAAGFVPGRPDDSMGVLCSSIHIPAQPGLLHPFETAAEIYYKIQLTSWASLKPDFQYIINPSGRRPDAVVVTVRAEIDF